MEQKPKLVIFVLGPLMQYTPNACYRTQRFKTHE